MRSTSPSRFVLLFYKLFSYICIPMLNSMNSHSNEISIAKFAMHYGILLGLFWAIKYICFVAASFWQHFIFLYYLLNAGTFLLIYIFFFKFRDANGEQPQKQMKCILFVVLMCFFATFFESATIYAHIQIIDPVYFTSHIQPTLEGAMHSSVELIENMTKQPYPAEQKEAMTDLYTNRFLYAMTPFFSNILLGVVFGSVLTLIVGNRKK